MDWRSARPRKKGLGTTKVTSDVAIYRGRRAVRLLNDDTGIPKGNPSGGQPPAIVAGSEFGEPLRCT